MDWGKEQDDEEERGICFGGGGFRGKERKTKRRKCDARRKLNIKETIKEERSRWGVGAREEKLSKCEN